MGALGGTPLVPQQSADHPLQGAVACLSTLCGRTPLWGPCESSHPGPWSSLPRDTYWWFFLSQKHH